MPIIEIVLPHRRSRDMLTMKIGAFRTFLGYHREVVLLANQHREEIDQKEAIITGRKEIPNVTITKLMNLLLALSKICRYKFNPSKTQKKNRIIHHNMITVLLI